jgi:hypothetical protein
MKCNVIENRSVLCWQEDCILFGVFKTARIDLATAMVAVESRSTAGENTPMHFVVDARKVKSISKEAREYLASEEGTHNVIATALIFDSDIGIFLGNFFLKINKPKVPLRIFSNYDEGVQWLNSRHIVQQNK